MTILTNEQCSNLEKQLNSCSSMKEMRKLISTSRSPKKQYLQELLADRTEANHKYLKAEANRIAEQKNELSTINKEVIKDVIESATFWTTILPPMIRVLGRVFSDKYLFKKLKSGQSIEGEIIRGAIEDLPKDK